MNKNYRLGAYLATLVTAIILVILICNGLASVQKQTEENCFTYLDEATTRLADDLYKTTDMDHAILSAMASIIAVQNDLSDSNLCAIMNSYVSSKSYVNYIEILRPDNTMLDEDGTVRDVKDAFNFNDEAKKGSYVSNICYSTKDSGEKVIRNAVPVKKNGQTIYMLYGTVNLSSFEKAYTTNIYNGNAYVYLVDGNTGDFLLDTWHNSFGNISDFFDRKVLSGGSFQDVAEKMKKGETGDIAFISQSTGDTLYMHYEPVEINNWSVIVTVQDVYALKEGKQINDTLFMMGAQCGIILLAYMIFVTLSLVFGYRRIHKLSMTDQVTGLKNRNAYDTYLNASKDKTFDLISCVFVDVNGLHELNNKMGHDAGDKMLCRVGQAMQTAFHPNCVFRTGGDEFVAIIEKMDEETCRTSADQMNKMIKEEGYSVAFGMVTQENATDVSAIINLADERMIENKKKYYSKHDRRMR